MDQTKIGSGALTGAAGGALMALLAMIYAASAGESFLLPFHLVASTVLGSDALPGAGGTFAIFVGLVVHALTSCAWGVAFALLFGDEAQSGARAIATGAIFGAAIWLVMIWAALPAIDETLASAAAAIAGPLALAHLIFGSVLGAEPKTRRTFVLAG